MMRKSLLILGLVATAGFIVSGLRGYQGASDPDALRQHLYYALGAGLLMLLSHSAIGVYLVATARLARSVAGERGLGSRYGSEARVHVRRALPAIVAAVVLLVLGVAAGGGLFARVAPAWLHHALVYAALAAQVLALRQEAVHLAGQDRLIADLDRAVGP
jgi:hypothetical protein